MKTATSLILLLALSGCASQPRPAKTEIVPGETKIVSEREETKPSSSTIRIKTETAVAPVPETPTYHIKVTLPPEASKENK